MKNWKNWKWMAIMMAIISIITTACDDEPSNEGCLVNGDPWCGNLPPNPGIDGGTFNCLADSNYGKACLGSNNAPGVLICTPDGTGLVCSTGPGATDGGPYNCGLDPNLGKSCTGPSDQAGTFVCNLNGTGLVCHIPGSDAGDGGAGGSDGGTGPGPSYNCAIDPLNGKVCTTPGGQPGIYGCNPNGTALICHPSGGGGSGGSDGGTGGSGGSGGSYNCLTDPALYTPCTTSAGKIGVKVCNPSGTGLICQCTVDCGSGGSGGSDGGTGGSGGGVYNCATDPLNGKVCTQGAPYSSCFNTGIYICNLAGDGLVCSVGPKSPNPLGEICSNGIDDDCNGAIDDSPCTPSGGGGSGGGDGGTGGSGGDGGTGGSGGGASCTTATTANIMVTGASSLTTLLSGAGSVNTSNPLSITLFNGQLISMAEESGLAITASAGLLNFWEPDVPGDDPTQMLDNLLCLQLGITPPTPANCNSSVWGDRKNAVYLAALRVDWQCWRYGGAYCPASIMGKVPGNLFKLRKTVAPGDPLSGYNFSGLRHGVLEMPPLCPL